MIRESKIHQIDGVITSSQADGMMTMDGSLLKLYKEGKIADVTAISFATQPELMKKKMAL
jgi:twitching motility protein PilT